MPHRDVVVIGASAGGLEVLRQVLRELPGELPAAVFVVAPSVFSCPECSGKLWEPAS